MATTTSESTETTAATCCRSCGLVAAPPERFGCEACGAPPEAHDAIELALLGTVKSFATVWRHAKPTPATPFVVVQVLVDGGPALKGVLDDGLPAPAIGDRVRGRVEQTTEGPLLRWEPVGGGH